VHFPQEFQTAHDLQNSPIGIVSSSGIATIRWLKEKDVKLWIRISVKTAIPENPNDTRVLHFTAAGLDILDAHGNPLRRTLGAGVKAAATISKDRFQATSYMRELWQAVCKAHDIEVEGEEEEGPAIDWGPKGVAALTAKANKIDPPQNLPKPERGDANFLLYEFWQK
jgi:hypothetical protein